MLRLEDRIQVAMGAGMGIQLSKEETVLMAGLLLAHHKLEGRGSTTATHSAIAQYLKELFK